MARLFLPPNLQLFIGHQYTSSSAQNCGCAVLVPQTAYQPSANSGCPTRSRVWGVRAQDIKVVQLLKRGNLFFQLELSLNALSKMDHKEMIGHVEFSKGDVELGDANSLRQTLTRKEAERGISRKVHETFKGPINHKCDISNNLYSTTSTYFLWFGYSSSCPISIEETSGTQRRLGLRKTSSSAVDRFVS